LSKTFSLKDFVVDKRVLRQASSKSFVFPLLV